MQISKFIISYNVRQISIDIHIQGNREGNWKLEKPLEYPAKVGMVTVSVKTHIIGNVFEVDIDG